MDELDGRSDVRGQSGGRGTAPRRAAAVCILILAVSACGRSPGAAVTAGGGSTVGTSHPSSAVSSTTRLKPTHLQPTHLQPTHLKPATLMKPGPACPVSVATVASITGARLYEEASTPRGSCAFDSTPGGRGLLTREIRVNIQTGSNDLASLYAYFVPQAARGVPGCRPFQVVRRPDLGPSAFETLCGATPTSGPSSADDFVPLEGNRALTVTVNRGVGVRDHTLATCAVEAAAVLNRIRAAW